MPDEDEDRTERVESFKFRICQLADEGGIHPDEMIAICLTIASGNIATMLGTDMRARQLARDLLDGYMDDAEAARANLHPDDHGQVH